MNNDALFAALGTDAVAAVHGYRLHVIAEAGRRGMRLVNEPLPGVGRRAADGGGIDPLDIRLIFDRCPARGDLAGGALSWTAEHGWSCRPGDGAPRRYYAGPSASALDLVPRAASVLDWVTGAGASRSVTIPSPPNVELDDDPDAIKRLLGFVEPRRHVRGREISVDSIDRAPRSGRPGNAYGSNEPAASATQRSGAG
jgi:hypothetical protein